MRTGAACAVFLLLVALLAAAAELDELHSIDALNSLDALNQQLAPLAQLEDVSFIQESAAVAKTGFDKCEGKGCGDCGSKTDPNQTCKGTYIRTYSKSVGNTPPLGLSHGLKFRLCGPEAKLVAKWEIHKKPHRKVSFKTTLQGDVCEALKHPSKKWGISGLKVSPNQLTKWFGYVGLPSLLPMACTKCANAFNGVAIKWQDRVNAIANERWLQSEFTTKPPKLCDTNWAMGRNGVNGNSKRRAEMSSQEDRRYGYSPYPDKALDGCGKGNCAYQHGLSCAITSSKKKKNPWWRLTIDKLKKPGSSESELLPVGKVTIQNADGVLFKTCSKG